MSKRGPSFTIIWLMLAGLIVGCSPQIEENAVFLNGTAIFNNSSRGQAIANVPKGTRTELTRKSEEMCYVKLDRIQGWVPCEHISVDQGATFVEAPLASSNTSTPRDHTTQNRTVCTISVYRADAQPLMDRLNRIAENTTLRDASERRSALEQLDALERDIDRIPCRATFPLKHETLEYSARHIRAAIAYIEAEDYDRSVQSIARAAVNIERFNDWSVDITPSE